VGSWRLRANHQHRVFFVAPRAVVVHRDADFDGHQLKGFGLPINKKPVKLTTKKGRIGSSVGGFSGKLCDH
jgi:hypothetical protein